MQSQLFDQSNLEEQGKNSGGGGGIVGDLLGG
jgi:hypothetical protein